MKLSELIENLFTKYFTLKDEYEINELIGIITHGLHGFAVSEVSEETTNIINVLNQTGNVKGFYFFKWDISLYKKLWYMITNRYPIIVDIKETSDQILLNVNGKQFWFNGGIKPNSSVTKDSSLEIDISSDVISFCLKRGVL